MSIRQLAQGAPSEGAQIPFYDVPNGVDRRMTVAQLRALILGDEASDLEGWVTQYAAPVASGFTVTVQPTQEGQSVWLLITPTGAFAAGSVALPPVDECRDRQEIEIRSTQTVTTLTLTSSGATVNAPATLAANTPLKLRFDLISKTWYSAT